MKQTLLLLSLFISSWVYAQEYQFSANRTQAQIDEGKFLETPWVNSKYSDAKIAFAPIRRMMLVDPKAKILLNDVEVTLKNHGIKSVEEIVTVCQEDDEGASGFFNQDILSLDQRSAIPGIPSQDWSAEVKAQLQTAYSSKIVKLPFMEFVLITGRPTVCVMARESIQGAYQVFVHELTHFLKTDPFKTQEVLMNLTSYEEWLESTVNLPGGEFDAFEADLGAAVRLLKRLGITNPNLAHPFNDEDGELIDPEGLREYLIETYGDYYAKTDTAEEVMIYPREFAVAYLDVLENNIKPIVLKMKNAQLLMELEQEIARVKTKKAGVNPALINTR